MTRWTTPWLCLLAITSFVACTPDRPNILFIVVDTLRVDRLGCYGSDRGLTPFIDSLVARGTVFRRVYAQSSWTNPSIASMFTSRYQSQHGIYTFDSSLAESEITLPEVLKQHGYATGGFSANFLLQGRYGFDHGFDVYKALARRDVGPGFRQRMLKEHARRVNAESLAWLDTVAKMHPASPIFLYLHYMEPHAPYEAPDEVVDQVLKGRPRPDRNAINTAMNISNVLPYDAKMVQATEDLYDAGVLHLDMQLRELFTTLSGRGFLEDAIIVFTADHGEEFNEHGLMGHHKSLYEAVIRVPLIVVLPGQRTHKEVDTIVSLTDVAPTILDLLGIRLPAPFEGHSLVPLLPHSLEPWWSVAYWRRRQAPAAPRPETAFSELIKPADALRQSPHERAVVVDSGKLIIGINGERETYDLAADPAETNSRELPEGKRAALDTGLERLRGLAAPRATPEAARTIDPETQERMRALGYAH